MDKLTLAHEYAKISVSAMLNDAPDSDINFEMVAMDAFGLADAMFSEFEKRKDKTLPDSLWQPDWSLAPDDAVACAMDPDLEMWWCSYEPVRSCVSWDPNSKISEYPNHNYTGDWRNSLRIRPSSK